MKYAQIVNGKVFRVDDFENQPKFHPRIIMIPCGGEVSQGDIWDGSTFTKPPQNSMDKPITQYVDFLEKLGEDSYEALINSTSKKVIWIIEVWSKRGVINPNNQDELDAIDLMLSAGLISSELHGELLGT